MIKIDNNLLDQMGYMDLSDEQKTEMLGKITTALMNNVGGRLAIELSDDQLEQFQSVVDSGNDQKKDEWLKTNVPNYEQIISQELDKLIEQIKQTAEVIQSSLENDTSK